MVCVKRVASCVNVCTTRATMSDVEPAADHRHPKHNHSRSEVGGDGCGGIGGGTVVDAYGGLAQDDGGGSGLGGGGCMGGNDDEDDDRNTGNAGSSSGQCCMNTTLQIVLSTPGLVVLVVAYSVMGALIFPVLEAPVEQQPVVAVVTNSREECLKELWTITGKRAYYKQQIDITHPICLNLLKPRSMAYTVEQICVC